MAYDALHQRVVMFGGEDGTGTRGDTWLWDGAAWQEVTPILSPAPRSLATMAYDPIRQRIVLFGGRNLADTWEWDGTAWFDRTTTDSPSPRRGASMIWHPTRNRLVLFGGRLFSSFDTYTNEVWEVQSVPGSDQLAWEQQLIDDAPQGRSEGILLPDTDGGLLLFGGEQFGLGGGTEFAADPWRLIWDTRALYEVCTGGDADRDGASGCADVDCWSYCTPLCPPLASGCTTGSSCGDGTCNDALESCELCPGDCGACEPACSDHACDPSEAATCPGDC